MRLIYKLILILNLLLIVPTIISYYAPFIDPSKFAIPGILAAAFPMYLIAHLFFIVFWLITKWKYSLISLILFVVCWGHVSNHVGLGKENLSSNTIKLASFNLFGLKKLKKADDKPAMARQLRRVLDKPDFDIICLQENNNWSDGQLKKLLDYKYAYQFQHAGVKLLSKFEITDKGAFDFNSGVNGSIWVDLNIGEKTTRVYCAHLMSNRVSKDADDLWEKADIAERETWLGVRNMLSKYKHSAISRKEQSNIIKTHANKTQHPVIICGDLNDHPLSYTYRSLSYGCIDAFRESGSGFGTTYNGRPPMLRIDYILADSTLTISSYRKIKTDVSDHHLIYANLISPQ